MALALFLTFLSLDGTWKGEGAHAHPGRLNSEGCHNVQKDLAYPGGQIVKKGDYHCHRTMSGDTQKGLRLDGFDRLQDEKEVKERKKIK